MHNEPTPGTGELFEAVYGGDKDAVVRLLRAGVPVEAADAEGRTALYLAAVSDEAGLVRLLLAAGADPGRPSGPDGGDLPLCGAACGGHTEVVRALLAAGARPDGREEFGFTAVSWAVVQGFADTLETLLEYGADPALPGPNGEAPLLLAARRGSTPCVRVLLRYGAGSAEGAREAALAEALRWTELDVERELRAGLLDAYGDGYETVVRRVEKEDTETVVVELLRGDVTLAGREQDTGHAAVATILEAELGIPTAFEALAARALACGDPGRDDWREPVEVLSRRGDEETYRAAAAWCASEEPLRQTFAVEVLGRLGPGRDGGTNGPGAPAGERAAPDSAGASSAPETEDGTGGTPGRAGAGNPFTARVVPLLRELSRRAVEPELVRAVVAGLGRHGDPASLPEILRHRAHPDPDVRRAVALALTGPLPGEDREAVRALTVLSRDADGSVRDRAVLALAEVAADTYEIREALAARLNDPDPDTAAEAAGGLAARRDPRAVEALARILADEDPDGTARRTALAAVRHVPDGPERRRLERTPPRRR
ncbi:ankyrin repeat domain-containing protein [Streptomyces hebeiensis]